MALPLLNKREHGKTTKVEQRREKTERKRERESGKNGNFVNYMIQKYIILVSC